jgi:hypothetical protein
MKGGEREACRHQRMSLPCVAARDGRMQGSTVTSLNRPTKINVVPHFSRLHEWIAMDEGYFQQEGLDPEIPIAESKGLCKLTQGERFVWERYSEEMFREALDFAAMSPGCDCAPLVRYSARSAAHYSLIGVYTIRREIMESGRGSVAL